MSESTPRIYGPRDQFFNALFPIFQQDRNCVMITADNGAPTLDRFAQELPRQFIQVGIAEQQMIAMAAGLAVEGKKTYCYAIAPFVTTRVHEFVKLDLCAMNLPIALLGIGSGASYDIMGPSHHTFEDISIMRALPNLVIWSPCDGPTAAVLAQKSYETKSPQYIRFDRAGAKDVYRRAPNLAFGYNDVAANYGNEDLAQPRGRADVVIIATSAMVANALEVAELLKGRVKVAVCDLFRLKPVPGFLLEYLDFTDRVVTLEEHYLNGGLGSIVAELFVDNGISSPLLRLGVPDEFVFDYGGRQKIWEKFSLDAPSVAKRISEWTQKT